MVDKLRPKGRITGDEIAFLKTHSPGTFKMTVPSPVMLSTFQHQAGVSDRAYPTWKDFFDDFTRLMADEVKAIVDDGITYVQVDAPGYSKFIVPERRKAQLIDQGLDPEDRARHAAGGGERAAARRQARWRHRRGPYLPGHLHPRPARPARRRRLDL